MAVPNCGVSAHLHGCVSAARKLRTGGGVQLVLPKGTVLVHAVDAIAVVVNRGRVVGRLAAGVTGAWSEWGRGRAASLSIHLVANIIAVLSSPVAAPEGAPCGELVTVLVRTVRLGSVCHIASKPYRIEEGVVVLGKVVDPVQNARQPGVPGQRLGSGHTRTVALLRTMPR